MDLNKLLAIVRDRLVSTYQPKEIYLFGSYAWGTPGPDSDLDMLVLVSQSSEPRFKRGIVGSRALRGLGIAKDILVYTVEEFDQLAAHVSTLCYKIKHDGKKIYEAA